RWTPAGSLAVGRADANATMLPDGRVLVTGGYQTFDHSPFALGAPEVYDPATNSWRAAGHMADGHWRAPTPALPNGRVLVAGGCDGTCGLGSGGSGSGGSVATAELYDPVTDRWST